MKKTVLTISILVIGILLIMPSCDDNSRSPYLHINIATVIPEGENEYSLLLDNGTRLKPVYSDVRYEAKENQRVLLNYTILWDNKGGYNYDIKVNDIWNILTKQAIELTVENADSIGNDPVKVNDVWVGGDYLNVSFRFNYGGVRPHMLNLVQNTLSSEATPDMIDLEFRHNAYNSMGSRLYEGFVCFDLKPFRVEDADSVNLSIKVKEWDREVKYDVVYRYSQPAREAMSQKPTPVISFNEYY